ncbi:MAG: glycosyltransferase family 2 protein [Flavobacteriales bacterium]|nr:glycosyltransferase family 2 protein [Flavobacteriales bacterium]
MNTAPRVTVIVPTHNYAAFIGDALRSVLAQTFTDWECIVVDDASTDGTAAIAREFVRADERFNYIRLERNSGVSAARNRAFAEARGEFIQMLDADDVIAPGKLEAQVTWMDGHQDIDVLYGDYFAFRGIADFASRGAYRPDEQVDGSGDAIVARLLRSNIFRLNTVLLRKRSLNDVGGFREGFRYVEDWDFWLRLAAKGASFRFVADRNTISGVRSNPDSLSSDKRAMSDHYLPVLQHLWVHGRLSLKNRFGLLVRYVFFMIDRCILGKGRVIIIPDGRAVFLVVLVLFTVFLLPFWPLYRFRILLSA